MKDLENEDLSTGCCSGGCGKTVFGEYTGYHKSDINRLPKNSCRNIPTRITKGMENFFYKFGHLIGYYPWWTIIFSLILCGACSSGLALFYRITDDEFLWTPYGSETKEQEDWIHANFPKDMRYESALLEGPNVLQADYIQFLARVVAKVDNESFTSDGLHSYHDICIRDLSPNASTYCYQESVIAIWSYDMDIINSLTDQDVQEAVTLEFNKNSSVSNLIAGATRDPITGTVTSALAITNVWIIHHNDTHEEHKPWTDPIAEDWEDAFMNIITGDARPEGLPQGAHLYGMAESSFTKEIDDAVSSNSSVLFLGCFLIVFYVAAVMGRLNIVEQRVILSFLGLLVIGMATFASFGFCFFLNIFFADLQPIIPFLLLGIGVDDMFVITEALENLSPSERKYTVDRQIALTMKHAGVSITVTSITDTAAFLIGATTTLPILRSFCLFAAFGVIFLYIFAATFFVACLTLDQQRMEQRKVTYCGPRMRESWQPNKLSQRNYGKLFMEKVMARVIFKRPVMAGVILVTLAIFGGGIYGSTQMSVNYDPLLYTREDSDPYRFYTKQDEYFPNDGERVEIYTGDIAYWSHLQDMLDIETMILQSSHYEENSIKYWFSDYFKEYCNTKDIQSPCADEMFFKQHLGLFLADNPNFALDLKFNVSFDTASLQDFLAGRYELTAGRLHFQHSYMTKFSVQNAAMEEIKDGCKSITFEGESFTNPIAYSFFYMSWEANNAMAHQLSRNIALAFVVIILVTVILIADLRVSIVVLISVVVTVVDVWGYAYYLGYTVEICPSINIILCIGLALDYAAHIGVAYVCSRQLDRKDRTIEALVAMGAPVFHGGFSTFLAFFLLLFSSSYPYLAFSQMFGLVVLFGLFHGLVLTPTLLRLIGPSNSPDDETSIMKNSDLPTTANSTMERKESAVSNTHSDMS